MLIKSLCRQEPSERLGYQKGGVNDIRKHKWFGGFDWDGFHAQRVPAPILPDVQIFLEIALCFCIPRLVIVAQILSFYDL